MSKALITESKLTAIANAIRTKGETTASLTPDEMVAAIQALPSGGGTAVESVTITNKAIFTDGIEMATNGTYSTYPLEVTVSPSDAPQIIQVTSSDTSVVSIINNGDGTYSLRVVNPGTTTITVSDYTGQITDSFSLDVTMPTTAIKINGLPTFCDKDTTYQLLVSSWTPMKSEANGVVWTSSDDSTATVSSTGLVTFVGLGAVTITATVNGYPSVKATTSGTVVANETDPDFDAISALIQAGTAEESYPVGSTLNVEYKEGGTTYTMPLIVMDYRTAELEDGTTKNGMVLLPQFTTVNGVRYSSNPTSDGSIVALTASSGETTAQEGYYYYNSNNVPMNLETGDALDFSVSATIYKSTYNVSTAQKFQSLRSYGDRRWAYSNARKWLNETYKGYYSSSFTSHILKAKVTTVDDTYVWSGDVRTTYDEFFLESRVENLMGDTGSSYTSAQIANEGKPFQYYINCKGDSTPSSGTSYEWRKKARINAQTSFVYRWLRSVASAYTNSEFYVNNNGSVGTYNAYSAYYVAPACIIG